MKAKYNKIGVNYNRTRLADPYLTEELITQLRPTKAGRYMDIGCGTGNYTNALYKKGFQLIGIDPSVIMLEKAKAKNPLIDWRVGTAENTGLPNDHVDGIIGTLTIHHWANLKKGFSELFRVLKKDGTLVIFTSTPLQMKGYWLHNYFPKMMSDSIAQMPTYEHVITAMTVAGFVNIKTEVYTIKPDLEDKFLYCGKLNPEIYFDENIRHGISSFSALANREEVENGLVSLRKDIKSGKITKVIQSYENDLGDYLYLLGEKKLRNSIPN